jgi:Secretion system C-terminal sorting domain
MKKFLLSIFTVGAFANLASAQCTELFISEYTEGTFNNKAIEIFNPTINSITLTGNYRIIRWQNGATNSDVSPSTGDLVQPITGTIASGGTFTLLLDRRNPNATAADTILFADLLAKGDSLATAGVGAYYSPVYNAAVQGSKCMSYNGDDALSLQKNVNGTWTNVDIFGSIGERPTNGNGTTTPTGGWTDTPPYATGIGAYLSKDKTLIRQFGIQSGVSVNPAALSFNILAEWDSLPVNTFTNLGYHDCLCTVGLNELKKSSSTLLVYPNPAVNELVYVRAASLIQTVEITDALGKQVSLVTIENPSKTFVLNTKGLNKGLYFISAITSKGDRLVNKINIQ